MSESEPTAENRPPISEVRSPTSENRGPTTEEPGTAKPTTAEPVTENRKPKSRFRKRPVRYSILIALTALTVYLVIDYLRLPSVADLKDLAKQRPKTTAMMERRKSQAADLGRTLKIRAAWVPLSSMSQDLLHAVVTTEDASFYIHNGIDWEELQISLKRDLEEGDRLRGASTITQQLAKNLYLDPSRSPLRKLREMVIARRMEEALSKARILELYLNLIEWGPGVFGCETASQTYFGVGCGELSREQAARMAAVIASPLKHHPNGDDRFVTRRTTMILNRLDAYGF